VRLVLAIQDREGPRGEQGSHHVNSCSTVMPPVLRSVVTFGASSLNSARNSAAFRQTVSRWSFEYDALPASLSDALDGLVAIWTHAASNARWYAQARAARSSRSSSSSAVTRGSA